MREIKRGRERDRERERQREKDSVVFYNGIKIALRSIEANVS